MNDKEQPRPEALFTPRAPVGREMFSRREEGQLQQKLEDSLAELGSQIMLYGDTGVGKTSLLLHVAGEMGKGVARIECFSGKSFQDLIRDAFAAIAEVQELRLEVTDSKTKGSEVSAGAGFGFIAMLKGRFRADVTTTEKREFTVVQQPLIDALIDMLIESGKSIIFFDNFENVRAAAVKRQVTEFIGFISDRASDTGNVKVVLAGIADTASDLLTLSAAASRRTVEFEVPRMPETELARIVTRGVKLLKLRVRDAVASKITSLSDGFPYVTHLLGLHAAREAIRDGSHELAEAHLNTAIQTALAEFREEFRTSYGQARELSGEVRPREHIMIALAWAAGRDFRSTEIAQIYRKQFKIDPRKGLAFLNVALGQLVTPKYGSVLRRRGSRGRYQYSFANPLMRPYIRLKEQASEA